MSNIYHGDSDRGSQAGFNCTFCHNPTSNHSNPGTKTGVNYACNNTVCHGDSSTSYYISETHYNADCSTCHNNGTLTSQSSDSGKNIGTNIHAMNSSWLIPFNITSTILTNANCMQCHDNSSYVNQTTDCVACHDNEIHSSTMNVTANVGDFDHGGGANCGSCHYSGGPLNQFAVLNVTAFNTASALHGDINTTSETGYEANEPCWACHGNGSRPPEGKHTDNYGNPFECVDCHSPDKGNYSAPIVYEHVPTSDVTVAGSCESCHNRSVIFSNDTGIPNDGANISHYGKTAGLKVGSSETSTKDCIGCHKESTAQSNKWRAGRLYLPDTSHSKTKNTANGCWSCHLTTKASPASSFHDEELKRPGWSCGECHT